MLLPRAILLEESNVQATRLTNHLQGKGWITLWAQGVEAAARSFGGQYAELLLMDARADKTDLKAAMERVRSIWPGAKVALMIEGSVDAGALRARRGVDFILRRPLDWAELDGVLVQARTGSQSTQGWASVLVVEDSATIRRIVDQAARMVGLGPVVVGSMEEALEKLAATRFDCVVTDIFMPGMGGIAGIPQIRKRAPGAAIVAMSSGCGDTMGFEEALRAAASIGADRCLPKPFTPQQLADAVRSAIAALSVRKAA